MNPDSPQTPRQEVEARLTALLLGELPTEAAAALRAAIAQDPELAALHARLKQTVDLVRETAAQPVGETAGLPAPLRLSEERRQKLLAHFKTITPKEFAPARRERKWLTPVSVAAGIVALAGLAGLFLPATAKSKAKAQRMAALNNSKQLGIASRQWEQGDGDSVSAISARNVDRFGVAEPLKDSPPSAPAAPVLSPPTPSPQNFAIVLPADNNAADSLEADKKSGEFALNNGVSGRVLAATGSFVNSEDLNGGKQFASGDLGANGTQPDAGFSTSFHFGLDEAAQKSVDRGADATELSAGTEGLINVATNRPIPVLAHRWSFTTNMLGDGTLTWDQVSGVFEGQHDSIVAANPNQPANQNPNGTYSANVVGQINVATTNQIMTGLQNAGTVYYDFDLTTNVVGVVSGANAVANTGTVGGFFQPSPASEAKPIFSATAGTLGANNRYGAQSDRAPQQVNEQGNVAERNRLPTAQPNTLYRQEPTTYTGLSSSYTITPSNWNRVNGAIDGNPVPSTTYRTYPDGTTIERDLTDGQVTYSTNSALAWQDNSAEAKGTRSSGFTDDNSGSTKSLEIRSSQVDASTFQNSLASVTSQSFGGGGGGGGGGGFGGGGGSSYGRGGGTMVASVSNEGLPLNGTRFVNNVRAIGEPLDSFSTSPNVSQSGEGSAALEGVRARMIGKGEISAAASPAAQPSAPSPYVTGTYFGGVNAPSSARNDNAWASFDGTTKAAETYSTDSTLANLTDVNGPANRGVAVSDYGLAQAEETRRKLEQRDGTEVLTAPEVVDNGVTVLGDLPLLGRFYRNINVDGETQGADSASRKQGQQNNAAKANSVPTVTQPVANLIHQYKFTGTGAFMPTDSVGGVDGVDLGNVDKSKLGLSAGPIEQESANESGRVGQLRFLDKASMVVNVDDHLLATDKLSAAKPDEGIVSGLRRDRNAPPAQQIAKNGIVLPSGDIGAPVGYDNPGSFTPKASVSDGGQVSQSSVQQLAKSDVQPQIVKLNSVVVAPNILYKFGGVERQPTAPAVMPAPVASPSSAALVPRSGRGARGGSLRGAGGSGGGGFGGLAQVAGAGSADNPTPVVNFQNSAVSRGGRGGGVVVGASAQRTYPNAASSGPTSVSVDPETHSLIISTDDRKIADIQAMADKMAKERASQSVQITNGRVGPAFRGVGGLITITNQGSVFTVAQNAAPAAPAVSKSPPMPVGEDVPTPRVPTAPLVPQPEVQVSENAFSTFSLNVSDVAYKLAAASLEKGLMPDAGSMRSEEFINAFDYRDPDPAPGAPIGFASELARDPFAQNRDLLRFAVKTAAAGRQPGRPMNITLLLDNSGSMERADRVAIIHEALRVLATQLQSQDRISVVTFARTARLWVDGIPGDQAGQTLDLVGSLTPEGGTDLGDALTLAYATARRHYLANGVNRIVLLTDGAANLGNVDPEVLKENVDAQRKQGIALDCFGIGWEGYNDDLLEVLTRNGDGRYGFINTPEEAATDFAGQLAGALHVAASDVKVQVEFNPKRVTSYRQIGYAKHQLTKEQFRDNTVHAAQIAAAEAGNALYTVEVNPQGEGPVCTVHVRYRDPGTADYYEKAWDVPYNGGAPALENSSPAMRLAATAAEFSEWLAGSQFAAEVTPDALLGYLGGVPEVYGADARPKQLEWMIRQAKSASGK